ncbi:hypothetical protein BDN72DRAFT_855711 [Pluteus cervinus]|uniref:Uncharacterized protein n=1 Tax=Pluteus cervinus TaxID=181527 RepID=A0ACD3B269_9AGAR|nr:hypothetical protein BDN72DRAFT_855711 [Pluteus cervinus]
MSVRSFTVFQDSPSIEPPEQKALSPVVLSPLSPQTNVMPTAALATVPGSLEKENVHPVTGERAGAPSATTKKRKTVVLATKLHLPLEGKKKVAKESQPEAKKRKSTASSTSDKGTTTSKSSTKKDSKSVKSTSSSTRKVTKKRSTRRIAPLPKVEEEARVEQDPVAVSNALIDSRCYDLTVKPLADVTPAYEPECDKPKPRSTKETSAEPELRDYFVPVLPTTTFAAAAKACSSTSPESPARPFDENKEFSTPERKRIYATFTFCSPSPTAERYSQVTRAMGMPPRLDLSIEASAV